MCLRKIEGIQTINKTKHLFHFSDNDFSIGELGGQVILIIVLAAYKRTNCALSYEEYIIGINILTFSFWDCFFGYKRLIVEFSSYA